MGVWCSSCLGLLCGVHIVYFRLGEWFYVIGTLVFSFGLTLCLRSFWCLFAFYFSVG